MTAQGLHASAVAFAGRGILILGQSGAGKSSLALQLMALSARLIADDRVDLTRESDSLHAAAPQMLFGLIEARGVGILRSDALARSRIDMVVDLDQTEEARLPPDRTTEVLGVRLPVLWKCETPAFPAAILQYVRGGRAEV